MRVLNFFAVTLVCVLGLSSGAQAVTLTMTTDKANYLVGETITLTVIGDSQGVLALTAYGAVIFDNTLVSADGGQTQVRLTADGLNWIAGLLRVEPSFQESFSQINGSTTPRCSAQKLTAIMRFTAGNTPGVATFSWMTVNTPLPTCRSRLQLARTDQQLLQRAVAVSLTYCASFLVASQPPNVQQLLLAKPTGLGSTIQKLDGG